jgi:predicted metal-binding protein
MILQKYELRLVDSHPVEMEMVRCILHCNTHCTRVTCALSLLTYILLLLDGQATTLKARYGVQVTVHRRK